ncbi:Nod factor export ATP-binding protein I, putative [Perkinsus marinus ATCC 50983]|uniref:Nod factor export ATP-binding protein I, putative n=1 Tax=Perkinsus marinus (strain ATCC 50983 / TXsc) TaxID=423536 RepID=C5LZU2_PERM5|nr:Nod factor export ATP-binding protein I, putative [Perkinsus marinus ATCC 50983]EEQ97760.1 Nod factor export ATP-binding protein I, putative [Perkinsus marinus ATCC 50983]|eukprot:XP_002765043.1 Nod factor export ATP-binding protein I, putative [Perkinsus marinus ATCC 50983]
MSARMKKYTKLTPPEKADRAFEAEDLREEALRADTIVEGISVRNLTKIYPKQKKAAVESLDIGVAPAEIVVLLGPNGAGKTTTMKMLTGDEIPTAGLIKLGRPEDFKVAQSGRLDFGSLYRRQVCGYCPQVDALFPELTVEEHLKLASTLKGLRLNSSASFHQQHMDSIVAGQHFKTRSAKLSGGNRRKLSLALSMLGCPRVMFLDEVTTGMDPAARRSVWAVLRGEGSRPAILMSTHYMDEASALSTRVGIMINGEMRVIGNVNELTNRFSRAISIEASLSEGFSASFLADSLSRALGITGVVVVEDFNSSVTLRVPLCEDLTPTQQIAELFRIMEGGLKTTCGVVYYNTFPMSLEQIFIDLVREQRA